MSPRTPDAFQQLRDDRRELILQAASQVFARKGLATTKIADVAAAAGVSYGLVYHYFRTKDAVFAALVERAAQSTEALAHMILAQPLTAWGRLEWTVQVMLVGLQQQPEAFMITLEAVTREEVPAESRQRLERSSGLLRDVLGGLLREGQAAGLVCPGDPEQLITTFLSCIHGLAITLLAERKVPAHFPTADHLLRIFRA